MVTVFLINLELAHQWFGNLVSPAWWQDLWLNEGFATFVGWLIVDQLYPDWNVWTQFVDSTMSSGLSLDALRSSHPIEVTVNKPAEILQIFDAISYIKGCSLIRMLSWYLGQDVFMNGVRTYLKEFAYSNAETKDLWRHLSKASGKDIASLMTPWTTKTGYPVVSVVSESYNEATNVMTLSLKQSRFLSSGDWSMEEENAADSTIWWVPLEIVTDALLEPIDLILTAKNSTVSFSYKQSETSYYKINYKCRGFYRVKNEPKSLKKLSGIIHDGDSKLTLTDRIGLLSDSFAMAESGYSTTVIALELVVSFKNESEYIVTLNNLDFE